MVKGKKYGHVVIIVLGVGAVVSLVGGGCSDYGDMVARELAYTGLEQAIVSGVQNEIEGPRGTTVNVNNPSSGHVLPSGVPQMMEPTIEIYRWKDHNGDGTNSMDEILGKVDESINNSNMGMVIDTNYGKTLITYTLLDFNDTVILKIDIEGGVALIMPGKLAPGKYTIVAQQGNNTSLSREFTVTRTGAADSTVSSQAQENTLWHTYLNAGFEAQNKGQAKEAVELFQDALREAEKCNLESYHIAWNQFLIGDNFKVLNRLDEAEEWLRKALTTMEKQVTNEEHLAAVFLDLAAIENSRGNTKKARILASKSVTVFSELIGTDPNSWRFYQNRAVAFSIESNFDHAIRDMGKAIELAPDQWWCYNQRALIYSDQKKYQLALCDFEKVSELNQDNGQLLNALAWMLCTCPDETVRDGERALEFAKKAVLLDDRRSADFLGTLAAAYAEVGQFDHAITTQEEAIALSSDAQLAGTEGYSKRLETYRNGQAYREVEGD